MSKVMLALSKPLYTDLEPERVTPIALLGWKKKRREGVDGGERQSCPCSSMPWGDGWHENNFILPFYKHVQNLVDPPVRCDQAVGGIHAVNLVSQDGHRS